MNNKSLAFKLNISFLILMVMILCSAIYSILMNNKTQGYANEVSENWFPSLNAIASISNSFTSYSRRHITIIGFIAVNLKEKMTDAYLAEFNKWGDEIVKGLDNYDKHLLSGQDEKELFQKAKKAWQDYQASANEVLKVVYKNPVSAYDRYSSETIKRAVEFTKHITELTKYNFEHGVQSSTKGDSLTVITNLTMAGIVTAAILISLIIFQIIRKSTNSISTEVNNLKTQSVSTSKIASDLKTGSQSLSDSVAEQAASVHETSAAINEITSMVNRTAENAKESTNVAKSASDKAEEGQKTMQRLGHAMETIQESSGQLQNIAVIINQINAKTAVINDIVSKTELLSLNASIESARAGEYGKGFAVVAEEVGNLAKISGKSAHEIQELITSSQEQVNQILTLTKGRVEEGKSVTAEAQEAFTRISEDISNMSNVIQQISEATREQEIGVRQISTAMSQIDKATQNSQIAVNTASDSSNNLVEQSNKLDATAKNIEKLIKGKIAADDTV